MGLYRSRIFPKLMDGSMDRAQHRSVRDRVCASLRGTVLEIGFGSGLNLAHLPPAVTLLLAVDPMIAGRRIAARRLRHSPVPVEFVGVDGEALPLADTSVDNALSTWTLCTIPDPVAAVREIARVLRPGGSLRFAEHGRSPEPGTARWQRRLSPIQRRLAGGCHLDRDIPAILREGGLTITELDTYALADTPTTLGWTFEGAARVG